MKCVNLLHRANSDHEVPCDCLPRKRAIAENSNAYILVVVNTLMCGSWAVDVRALRTTRNRPTEHSFSPIPSSSDLLLFYRFFHLVSAYNSTHYHEQMMSLMKNEWETQRLRSVCVEKHIFYSFRRQLARKCSSLSLSLSSLALLSSQSVFTM